MSDTKILSSAVDRLIPTEVAKWDLQIVDRVLGKAGYKPTEVEVLNAWEMEYYNEHLQNYGYLMEDNCWESVGGFYLAKTTTFKKKKAAKTWYFLIFTPVTMDPDETLIVKRWLSFPARLEEYFLDHILNQEFDPEEVEFGGKKSEQMSLEYLMEQAKHEFCCPESLDV
jgi:hypothetical protein